MRSAGLALVATLALALAPTLRAAEATVVIKLGTLAPRGTSYFNNLKTMGAQWQTASGGAVRLNIYPDGTQGSEADMVGLMQVGSLDAGLLSMTGLSDLEPAVSALQNLPMSFRSLDEVDYVGDKLRPMLEKRLLAKGYVVLFWSDSGWVRFFSKRPALHPDELRKQKMFTWAGNPAQADIWRAVGFQPVVLETASVPQGLLSNTIEAVPMPPFFALASQLDRSAKYMLEINWAPLVGAVVVRQKTWERLPAATRTALLAIATETGKQIKADGRAESTAAVAAMVKRGLVVQTMTPAAEVEWREMAEKVRDQIRGKIVPADIFDEVQRLLKEFRATAATQPSP